MLTYIIVLLVNSIMWRTQIRVQYAWQLRQSVVNIRFNIRYPVVRRNILESAGRIICILFTARRCAIVHP